MLTVFFILLLSLGIHMGQKFDFHNVRNRIGKDKIFGLTVSSKEEIDIAINCKVDYIGTDSIYNTSRSNGRVLTIKKFQELSNYSKSLNLPIIGILSFKKGIGGINMENITEVLNNGADGIAMCTSIQDTGDITQSSKQYKDIISNYTTTKIKEKIFYAMTDLKSKKPVIHHITNDLVMNQTANLSLYVGALPIISNSHLETEMTTKTAKALSLNIGTLDDYIIKSMILSGKVANQNKIPVILDPVLFIVNDR
jgi:thiamine-phosphate diphosphorylase / hydroxyethylthiazole kinase